MSSRHADCPFEQCNAAWLRAAFATLSTATTTSMPVPALPDLALPLPLPALLFLLPFFSCSSLKFQFNFQLEWLHWVRPFSLCPKNYYVNLQFVLGVLFTSTICTFLEYPIIILCLFFKMSQCIRNIIEQIMCLLSIEIILCLACFEFDQVLLLLFLSINNNNCCYNNITCCFINYSFNIFGKG